MNLTIGAIDNSKLKDLVIDGPGTTTCLHRAPFYFVHAFEIFSETYADYVKKYFVNFASLPCDELFHATFRLQNGKYVAKPELSFLALGDDRTSWVQIVAVVHHNPDDGAKLGYAFKSPSEVRMSLKSCNSIG
ncbi:hypothetical protein GQ42DRAFT_178006 [Ramicandelaber brevisporus]|nr:hypothetical protein GQ42DRAFT_178006 [Ramicandelaber brevisporus]